MRTNEQEVYRCDQDRKRLNDKNHIRIVMPFTSGLMVPPFFGGQPAVPFVPGNPVLHFCNNAVCAPAWLTERINEANSRKLEALTAVAPVARALPAEASFERPSMPGAYDVGARMALRGEAD